MTRYADDPGPPSFAEYALAAFCGAALIIAIFAIATANLEFGAALSFLPFMPAAVVSTLVLNRRILYTPERSVLTQAHIFLLVLGSCFIFNFEEALIYLIFLMLFCLGMMVIARLTWAVLRELRRPDDGNLG